MSLVYVGSDFHLGHKNIAKFGQRPFEDHEENYQFIGDNYHLTKRDTLYLLGDIVFEEKALEFIQKLPAIKKILIPGNHEWQNFTPNMYDVAKTFDEIRGPTSYKGTWLSHFPIVESEFFRKQFNVHGHIHKEDSNPEIRDNPKYINVNVDYMYPKYGKVVMNWQELMEMAKNGKY